MKKLHKLILTAFFIAIAVLLPSVFHLFPGSGAIFLPMHIPVFLCGFICNPYYGAVCGIVSPVLSHLLTGMPAAAALPGMIFELTAYGALSGLFFRFFKKFRLIIRIYASLLPTMLCGRVIYGLLNGFIFLSGKYTLSIWVAAAFVTALPGIVIQLSLIPSILLLLKKGKLLTFS